MFQWELHVTVILKQTWFHHLWNTIDHKVILPYFSFEDSHLHYFASGQFHTQKLGFFFIW